MRRYGSTELVRGGRIVGTSSTCSDIHRAVKSGVISGFRYVIKGGDRLDQLAARQYGDGTLWWLIAAASGIGWGPQVPPGTVIFVPTDLGEIASFTG